MRNIPATIALAGAALLQPGMVNGASSTSAPSAASASSAAASAAAASAAQSTTMAPSGSSARSTTTTPSTGTQPASGQGTMPGRDHGFGNPNETVSDLSVVARAIGITETGLQAAPDNGQTVAAVARAHNVAVQTVIDALVQDELEELAADVKSGRLTQAQADAQKAAVARRATDQVNGTFTGGAGNCPAH